jgi:vancomycin aglycone glucosyltransferase
MRVLLSTIGSRGDVQPLVALALELKDLGQDVRLCVPPDFREWIEAFGLPVTPIGPELHSTATVNPNAALPTADQRRQMIDGTVATQFYTIAGAAEGYDVIAGATALQIAAPSVAERMSIPYVFVAYCPAVIPSRHHSPPVLKLRGDAPAPLMSDYSQPWTQDAQRWNDMWGDVLNVHRARLGLTPVSDVRTHVLTDHPWLAADPTLAPWPAASEAVFQSGAWLLADDRALSPDIEEFLAKDGPPIYFGFGSSRAPADASRTMIESARALGRRAIVSRGWAQLPLIDDAPDCLSIDDVNFNALFARVAAVVHHGGAGTTTAAARAHAPQVIIPHHYDQFYWAARVEALGIGKALASSTPTARELTDALAAALSADAAECARAIDISTDGARVAARRLIAQSHRRFSIGFSNWRS